jgi:DNA-binding MarR family transcriptional regulator
MKENHMEQAEMERLELEKEISQFLAQSFLELDEGERQLMKPFGLTLTQYWALVHLNIEEGRSLSELADLLICDKSNVTSVVDKLEESGLAERKRGKAGDRRYIRVVLTPQGQQLRNTLIATQEHLLRMRFRILDVEILQQLREPLQQLASTLQAQFKNNEVFTMIENSIEYTRAEQGTPAILSHISQDATANFAKS